MTIHAKLAKVQSELHAPKGQYNDFGKYSYRSCEDILKAVKPLLGDCTIVINDDIVPVGDRIYVKSIAAFSDGSESVTSTAFAREADQKKGMDSAQITGATSSYARKYALNGLLLIDDNKDADSHDNRNENGGEEEARRKALMDAVHKHQDSIRTIKDGIANDDLSTAAEAWFELTKEEMQSIWVAPTKGGPFTTKEREIMKSSEFRKAYFGESTEGGS